MGMQPSAPALIQGLPFAGLLISMAVFPIVAPRFWQRRMGLVALAWCATLLLQQALITDPRAAAAAAWHALLLEYAPFITMLLALYTTGGGVLVRGGAAGSPKGNTAMLALGVVAGSVAGTTAAAMVMIHPLLHANAHRSRKVHLVLFLIVLVANASITPLGNPPLYIGLLHGVPFFWPIRQLLGPLVVVVLLLLIAFYLIDCRLAAAEPPAPKPARLHIRGWWNVGLILVVIIFVMLQPKVQLGHVVLLGPSVPVTALVGVTILLLVTLLSARLTPRAIRQANDFTWHPMVEVAMLFAAIFITIGPVIDMLRLGMEGPLTPLLRLTSDAAGQPRPFAYFWLTGMLSAFLDNAPTYLVFFELAGLSPPAQAGTENIVLAAISAGAVFFGGLTYIGNAPNMMLRAIAAHRGVRMPSFFGFLLMAMGLLLPVLGLVSLIFFSE
jgi:Na+/H+ antiporter NhaD/arsenite permease-like protein